MFRCNEDGISLVELTVALAIAALTAAAIAPLFDLLATNCWEPSKRQLQRTAAGCDANALTLLLGSRLRLANRDGVNVRVDSAGRTVIAYRVERYGGGVNEPLQHDVHDEEVVIGNKAPVLISVREGGAPGKPLLATSYDAVIVKEVEADNARRVLSLTVVKGTLRQATEIGYGQL